MHEAPTTPVAERADAVAADRSPPRRGRAAELTALAIVGVLLLGSLAAGAATLYREFYGASAFVVRYLDLLADGRAADALAVPGVAMDAAALEAAGLPAASDALLRRAALTTLTDVETESEVVEGDVTRVTISYRAGDVDGRTTFEVRQDGWIGVAPSWRFATSPLAVVSLTVRGSMQFAVNGFEVDKRQVSAAGADVDPLAALPMAVFSPGLYSVSVDTAMSATPGAAVLADAPGVDVDVDIQAEATEEFVALVQQRVEEFLSACATQRVLQPTGCPFGLQVRNRIVDEPAWSIVQQPQIAVSPDGAGWRIEPADAVAHVDVDIRLISDGSLREVAEDVPFRIAGTITVLPDGTASIQVSGANAE